MGQIWFHYKEPAVQESKIIENIVSLITSYASETLTVHFAGELWKLVISIIWQLRQSNASLDQHSLIRHVSQSGFDASIPNLLTEAVKSKQLKIPSSNKQTILWWE